MLASRYSASAAENVTMALAAGKKQKEVYSLTHSLLLCSGGTEMAAGFSLPEQVDWTGKQGGSEEEWIPERHLSNGPRYNFMAQSCTPTYLNAPIFPISAYKLS